MLIDTIISGATTLVAAFAGAWFAFVLTERARKRTTVDERVAAANRAIFALLRQFNTLHNIKTQFIDPKRTDPLRLLNMRALPSFDRDSLHADLDALTFLLETEHREILTEVMMADKRFHSTIQAVNERSQCHREKAQPILIKADIREGMTTTLDAVESMLGHGLYVELNAATDQAIALVDRTLPSTQATADHLRAALLEIYPKRTFIRFIPRDD